MTQRRKLGIRALANAKPVAPLLINFQEEVSLYWKGHPVNWYLSHLSHISADTMRTALDDAAWVLTGGQLTAEQVPWHRLRWEDMLHLQDQMAELYAPATGNRILSAVRGVLKSCFDWDYISLNPKESYRLMTSPQRPIHGERVATGRVLTPDEFAVLFQICTEDPRPAGRRDAALLALMYNAGLRSSELVSLNLEDYRPITGTLVVQAGKGKKERRLSLGKTVTEPLSEWLTARGRQGGALFRPISKTGRLQSRRLTQKAVSWILQTRAAEAGVTVPSPHDLRRSYICGLLASGMDLTSIASLVGHMSIATTVRYARCNRYLPN
jgi:integrase/recombinase XerD